MKGTGHQIDQRHVRLVRHDLPEEVPGGFGDRELLRPAAQELPHRGAHLLVVEQPDAGPDADGDLCGDPARIVVIADPAAHPKTDVERSDALTDDVLGEEVRPHEVSEVATDRVLARGDDGRVRDGQSERTLEQRRDREPVGQRTHHAGLGRGSHISGPPDAIALEHERDHVNDRRGDQGPDGHQFHASQAAQLLVVGGGDCQCTHRAILPHGARCVSGRRIPDARSRRSPYSPGSARPPAPPT